MHVVAYLVNRYPEASLTTIRREVEAVSSSGINVLRFAHRPSSQPFAGERDQLESGRTEYLATGNWLDLTKPFLRVLIMHPRRLARAFGLVFVLKPLKLRNFSFLLLACRLCERLLRSQAEHLHVHFAQSSAVVAMLTRALGGPSWTMTVHGPEEFVPANRRMLAVLASAATMNVAISESAAAATRHAAAPHSINIRVIGMGVDREFLQPPVPISVSGAILCIARLEERKGHMVLLDAIEVLRAAGRTPAFELVGDGPFRGQLQLEVRRRGLEGKVRFSGWQTEQQVRERLDRCRFFVLPSLAEGLPVSIMEAFARARPVIASNVAGVAELVHVPGNGLLVPAGDAPALADAIAVFLNKTPAQLLELGMHGRLEVERRFQSKDNGQKLISLWQELDK